MKAFEDSAGEVWEVFEVHRTTRQALGVSPGLEAGWLAFVSSGSRRRLAPYPPEWEALPPAGLEQLCAKARDVTSAPRDFDVGPRRPGVARSRTVPLPASPAEQEPEDDPLDDMRAVMPAGAPSGSSDDVERAVRTFTHEARVRGVQAIAAMMALKSMLAERYSNAPAARDVRRVRRWFVEAYYFERNG